MKTKRLCLYGVAACLLTLPAFGLTGCSDEDPTEEKLPEEEGNGTQQKLDEIFGNATTGPQKVRTVNQLGVLTCISYPTDAAGPISVTPAKLNGEEITLITLSGTEEKEGQATSMQESALASYGKPNDYLTAVTRLFENGTVPKGKPVVVTGISLGGMIAQQVLGVKEITEKFTVKAVITFGSPITLPLDRQGAKVVRFADTHDKVPTMGEMILRMGILTKPLTKEETLRKLDEMDEVERIARTGKYTDPIETHMFSYIEDECWDDVDFLGDAQKGNVLELTAEMKFYPAPKLAK